VGKTASRDTLNNWD